MTYKSIVVKISSKAKEIAAQVDTKSNEMASQGYELVTMSITGSGKAILVFKTDKNATPEIAENTVSENDTSDTTKE